MRRQYFHPKLQCYVKSVKYDFEEKTGYVYMEDIDCVDMSACIKIFRTIDEKVERIFTFRGSRPDTRYFKIRDKWDAALPTT